jgi:hypothetical protein
MKLSLVSNRYPNNTNLNITNLTAANRENAAADFKKLKEKGEERMRVIRERMVELDLEEEFIEKILKEYPVEKIEGKLDLLMERRNIQNPAGWLRTALKNDYQGEEEEPRPVRIDSRFRGNDIIPNVIASDRRERGNPVNTPEQISREKASGRRAERRLKCPN